MDNERTQRQTEPIQSHPDMSNQTALPSASGYPQPSDPSSNSQFKDTTQPVRLENLGQHADLKTAEMPSAVNLTSETQPWFHQEETDELNSRWKSIQSQFVDEPCAAVEQCETLVAETADRLKKIIDDQQQTLAKQWIIHDDVSTEQLRITLIHYRSMLNHILKI